MKGRSIPYSAKELAWIETHCADHRATTCAAFNKKFGRRVKLANFNALCKRRGWLTGRTGQFVKGQEPPNKGKRCPPGKGGRHPNARKTQFTKGHAPHNTNYLGHERIDAKDGYVYLSVAETNPHTGYERRYVLKHKWLWEQANGPLPEGHCLKALDGNRQNCDPSNWEAIPRGALPYLNGRWNGLNYDEAPAEVRPAILTMARLKHAARSKQTPHKEPTK